MPGTLLNITTVTGFLGAGKTTFIKKLIAKKQNSGLLINDFGKTGTDAVIFANFTKEANIYEVNEGSLFCACRENEFVDGVNYFLQNNYSEIIIEASGMANPEGMQKLLNKYYPNSACRMKESICIVDPEKTIQLAGVTDVVIKQIQFANKVIISKTDICSDGKIKDIVRYILSVNPNAEIFKAEYGKIVELISKSIYSEESCCNSGEQISFSTLKLNRKNWNVERLKQFFCRNSEYLFRIKGFIKIDNRYYYVSNNHSEVIINETNKPKQRKMGLNLIYNTKYREKIVFSYKN